MWYLMNASSLTEKQKAPVAEIAWHWNDCHVYACKSQSGRELFAVDCGGLAEEVGSTHEWTIDTGRGHRRPPAGDERLTIENVIRVVAGKVITGEEGSSTIGLNKARPVYVFK